jgi:hypothetical protein
VGEYLLPLALTSESYPMREHARLAAQRIAELEAVLGATGVSPVGRRTGGTPVPPGGAA